MGKFIDLTGKKFGRLTVIKYVERKGKEKNVLCKCDCGNEKVVYVNNLSSGKTTSCGCFHYEKLKEAKTTHNMSNSPQYRAWSHMIGRCTNKNDNRYYSYGERGIRVCERWLHSFENFLEDMPGYKPDLSLDRINNDGNYEPNNCRWTTDAIQKNNRTDNRYITFNGETLTVAQWSRKIGMNYFSLMNRIKSKNWTIERALTESTRK